MDDTRIDADLRSYDDDYYRWTQQQAAYLRSGRLDRVDLENVAEEIESLGRSQESELESRYKVLCLHLLKQIVQPQLNGRSWEATIAEQRASIAVHLRKKPRPQIEKGRPLRRRLRDRAQDGQGRNRTAPFGLPRHAALHPRRGRGRDLRAEAGRVGRPKAIKKQAHPTLMVRSAGRRVSNHEGSRRRDVGTASWFETALRASSS